MGEKSEIKNVEKENSEIKEESKEVSKTFQTSLRIFWGQVRKVDRSIHDPDKLRFLNRIPFFENLKKGQMEFVANIVYVREYLENEYLFEYGQPGAALFIIQSGEVSVEIPTDNGEATQLAVLGKSTFIGELALLDEAKRSASARALEPTKVYALFRKDLDALAEEHPEVTSHIYKSLAVIVGNRLKATNELIKYSKKASL